MGENAWRSKRMATMGRETSLCGKTWVQIKKTPTTFYNFFLHLSKTTGGGAGDGTHTHTHTNGHDNTGGDQQNWNKASGYQKFTGVKQHFLIQLRWSRDVPLQQRRLTVSPAASGKTLPAGQGRWSCPAAQHWWGHTWSAGSNSGLPSASETWTYWRESNEGTQGWLRDWSISPTKKGWRSWERLAWRRAGSTGPSSMCVHTWREGASRTEPVSFQWHPVTAPEAMGTHWDTGGSLQTSGVLHCESDQARAQVFQGCCRVSILRNIQKAPGHGPGQPALGGPAWAGGWTRGLPEIPPASATLWLHMAGFLPLPVYTSTVRPREQLADFSTAKESGQSWPRIAGLTAHRTEEQKGPCVALPVPCHCRQRVIYVLWTNRLPLHPASVATACCNEQHQGQKLASGTSHLCARHWRLHKREENDMHLWRSSDTTKTAS